MSDFDDYVDGRAYLSSWEQQQLMLRYKRHSYERDRGQLARAKNTREVIDAVKTGVEIAIDLRQKGIIPTVLGVINDALDDAIYDGFSYGPSSLSELNDTLLEYSEHKLKELDVSIQEHWNLPASEERLRRAVEDFENSFPDTFEENQSTETTEEAYNSVDGYYHHREISGDFGGDEGGGGGGGEPQYVTM